MTEVGFEAYVGSLHRGWPSATSQVRVHLNLRRQQLIPQHFCHRSQRYRKGSLWSSQIHFQLPINKVHSQHRTKLWPLRIQIQRRCLCHRQCLFQHGWEPSHQPRVLLWLTLPASLHTRDNPSPCPCLLYGYSGQINSPKEDHTHWAKPSQ